MTIFHLVRHASHALLGKALVGRDRSVGLSDEGAAEADALAVALSRYPIAAIYSSPTRRTRETADIVARRLQLDVTVEPALDEIDFGDWTGQTFDALRSLPEWRRWNEFRCGARAPHGEAIIEVQARMIRLMIDLAARHEDQQVVLVGHGDPIKSVLAYWLGIPIDHFRRIDIAPASISRVALDQDSVQVISMNERIDDRA
jgi:probable phosphoglycerate mutase